MLPLVPISSCVRFYVTMVTRLKYIRRLSYGESFRTDDLSLYIFNSDWMSNTSSGLCIILVHNPLPRQHLRMLPISILYSDVA